MSIVINWPGLWIIADFSMMVVAVIAYHLPTWDARTRASYHNRRSSRRA